ncbi:MAG: hemerythrin family protein [Lachnospiraceae bacterium]|nr:hemerythrin family protein [Lachnospiraceae bacterium]
MKYQFRDDYLIGNTTIDNEHRQLFNILNRVSEDAERDDIDKRELYLEFLEELSGYATQHFIHEERYMESINDPQLSIQQKEHMAFLNYVHEQQMTDIPEDVSKRLKEVMEFGAEWLSHHILGSDIFIGSKMKVEDDSQNDNPFEFTKKYLTGIEFIDNQHEKLFEIIATINDSLSSMGYYDRFDSIMDIIAELKEYTEVHFTDEEEYMAKINYDGLEEQKKLHKAFIDRLASVNVDYIDENQKGYLEDLIKYLLDWLSAHILGIDKKIPKM